MVSLPQDSNESVEVATSKLKKNQKYIAPALVVFLVSILLASTNFLGYLKIILQPTNDPTVCPIAPLIAPQLFYKDNSTVLQILNDPIFRVNSAKKLSGAVQIDTTVHDEQADFDQENPAWLVFNEFHKYLETTFPAIFAAAEVSHVNTYGLVFEWKGYNSDLKPVVFAAHQDVVPVQEGTLSDWTHPPFDGFFDDTFIYGRGSFDCKNVLIGVLESLELLAKEGFKPQRTVIAAFGFDEEISGYHGAAEISKWLEDKYGKDGIYAIIDEGPGLIPNPLTNQIIGFVGTGEKGYNDMKITLRTPGGHSSIPPDNTNIGIISEVVHAIENDPYTPQLTDQNPMMKFFQCIAVNSDQIPSLQKKAILRASFDKLANSKVLSAVLKDPVTRFLVGTSQAVDVIHGGEKVNALPEYSEVFINHRVAVESSTEEIKQRLIARINPLAKKYGLGLIAFDKTIVEETENGIFDVELFGHSIEPAPVSPFNDH